MQAPQLKKTQQSNIWIEWKLLECNGGFFFIDVNPRYRGLWWSDIWNQGPPSDTDLSNMLQNVIQPQFWDLNPFAWRVLTSVYFFMLWQSALNNIRSFLWTRKLSSVFLHVDLYRKVIKVKKRNSKLVIRSIKSTDLGAKLLRQNTAIETSGTGSYLHHPASSVPSTMNRVQCAPSATECVWDEAEVLIFNTAPCVCVCVLNNSATVQTQRTSELMDISCRSTQSTRLPAPCFPFPSIGLIVGSTVHCLQIQPGGGGGEETATAHRQTAAAKAHVRDEVYALSAIDLTTSRASRCLHPSGGEGKTLVWLRPRGPIHHLHPGDDPGCEWPSTVPCAWFRIDSATGGLRASAEGHSRRRQYHPWRNRTKLWRQPYVFSVSIPFASSVSQYRCVCVCALRFFFYAFQTFSQLVWHNEAAAKWNETVRARGYGGATSLRAESLINRNEGRPARVERGWEKKRERESEIGRVGRWMDAKLYYLAYRQPRYTLVGCLLPQIPWEENDLKATCTSHPPTREGHQSDTAKGSANISTKNIHRILRMFLEQMLYSVVFSFFRTSKVVSNVVKTRGVTYFEETEKEVPHTFVKGRRFNVSRHANVVLIGCPFWCPPSPPPLERRQHCLWL